MMTRIFNCSLFTFRKSITNKLILSFLAITVLSCQEETTHTFIKPDNSLINYVGRFDFSKPNSVRFDWSGVQIRANFEGTSCSLKLNDGNNDYDIFIDGKLHKVLRTNSDSVYVLATKLKNKVHSLFISKRTEGKLGIATFKGFILDAGKSLVKIKDSRTRKIEFIGDSFIAGFGSEGLSADCKFSRETENCYISFGPQIARRLNADYSMVAVSGGGVVKNYGESHRSSEFPLPYFYDRTCMNDTLIWEFNQWQPDVVVLRLGRNDYWQKPHPKREMFRNSYLNLIKKIRRFYPNAHIFAICGPIRKDPHCNYIQSVVNELKGKTGDKKVYFIKLDIKFNPERDFGCEKHPNHYGHEKIADVLEPIIREKLKWESILKKIFPSNPFAKK